MVWVGLDEGVVAGVGVGRGERAGGDHGEVQDGGWGVGVSLLTSCFRKLEYGTKNEIVFWILVGIVFKVKAMIW